MKNVTRKANAVSSTGKGSKLAAATKLGFFLNAIARPASGYHVKAYTRAWMTLAGMQNGATMPKPVMQRIAGDTMVNYHLNKQQTLQTAENGELEISGIGELVFSDEGRKLDIALVNGYVAILQSGKADGFLVKNQAAISAL